MDSTYQPAPSGPQQPPVYTGSYLQAPYTANRGGLHELPPPPGHPAPPWTASPASDGQPYALPCDFPAPSLGGAGFGGPGFAPLYGFDPSVPPLPFGCPPPGHFPSVAPPAPVNAYSSAAVSTFQTFSQQFRAGPQTPRYDRKSVSDGGQNQYGDFREAGGPPCPPPRQDRAGSTEDETVLQRRQDAEWLKRFLQSREKTSRSPQSQQQQQAHRSSVPALREALYGAAELVSRLEESCRTLKHNVHNDSLWADSYSVALQVKRELQSRAELLQDPQCLDQLKAKVSHVAGRRARRLRARRELQLEEKHAEDCSAEKEAAIDKWRMKQIQQVEEKKKEQELKLAADSVLCEVRKKQADVKRMQDILRSLEKLRRLRKEAASRKGIVTEQQCGEMFSSRLEQLRCVMKRRTTVYSAEEKALMVMLEGEQEEERRREQEKRVKKERERQLQRKQRVDSMLFGEELPADCVLQPFREYYHQAEHSLHTLMQIRREWDVFVVAADHPDSSSVPQSWILPDPPSDQAWASALQTADTDGDSL